ncbi:hypothetical protein U1Q18_036396 [Sarracenia purpurea var. burkii]
MVVQGGVSKLVTNPLVKKPQTGAGLNVPMGISFSTNLEDRSGGPSGNGPVLQSPVTELVEEAATANDVDPSFFRETFGRRQIQDRGSEATFGDALKELGKLPLLPQVKAPVRDSWANVVKGGGLGPKPRQSLNLEYIAPTNPEESLLQLCCVSSLAPAVYSCWCFGFGGTGFLVDLLQLLAYGA